MLSNFGLENNKKPLKNVSKRSLDLRKILDALSLVDGQTRKWYSRELGSSVEKTGQENVQHVITTQFLRALIKI